MAAVLFKIEYAVRNGYTAKTSTLCSWNQCFTKKVMFTWSSHDHFIIACVYSMNLPGSLISSL